MQKKKKFKQIEDLRTRDTYVKSENRLKSLNLKTSLFRVSSHPHVGANRNIQQHNSSGTVVIRRYCYTNTDIFESLHGRRNGSRICSHSKHYLVKGCLASRIMEETVQVWTIITSSHVMFLSLLIRLKGNHSPQTCTVDHDDAPRLIIG